MKAAVFCARPLSAFVVYALLPDGIDEIVSAIGADFCAEAVARKLGCPCNITRSVCEAIEQADFVFVIWDGLSKEMVNAAKQAKEHGKKTMFSFIP